MTFEEFFKKKRIDLAALGKAEPALFSEFKAHFEQMGEKSFDHTKKYWFNKLRRQFHLPPELKPEKPRIENPLAEQTVTESLIESTATAPAAKPGFVPRFKAASMAKPSTTEAKAEETAAAPVAEKPALEPSIAPSSPKPGFTPRFKASNMPKPVVTEPEKEEIPPGANEDSRIEEKLVEPESAPAASPQKLGFVPKFRAGNMPKPAVPDEKNGDAPPASDAAADENPGGDVAAPKPAYKPRFNMKNISPKKENT